MRKRATLTLAAAMWATGATATAAEEVSAFEERLLRDSLEHFSNLAGTLRACGDEDRTGEIIALSSTIAGSVKPGTMALVTGSRSDYAEELSRSALAFYAAKASRPCSAGITLSGYRDLLVATHDLLKSQLR